MTRIENHTFDELAIGDSETFARALSPEDFERFAGAAGALDPDAVESGLATTNGFQAIAGESGWGGALIAAVIAGRFPGAGTVLVRQCSGDPGRGGAGRRHDPRRLGQVQDRRRPARRPRLPRRQSARRIDLERNRRGRGAVGEDRARPRRRPERGNSRKGPPLSPADRDDARPQAAAHGGRPSRRRAFAGRRRRGRARGADRGGARRSRGEDPPRRGGRRISTSRRSRSWPPNTATPRRRRPWRWRAPARSRR